MCRNGQYTEHGIKGLNGFGAERWRIDPDFAVKVDPELGILGVLLEPTSVVAKAWDHAHRLCSASPRTHAACSLPARGRSDCWQRCSENSAGYEVHVYDHNKPGPKAEMVRALGAHLSLRRTRRSRESSRPMW